MARQNELKKNPLNPFLTLGPYDVKDFLAAYNLMKFQPNTNILLLLFNEILTAFLFS